MVVLTIIEHDVNNRSMGKSGAESKFILKSSGHPVVYTRKCYVCHADVTASVSVTVLYYFVTLIVARALTCVCVCIYLDDSHCAVFVTQVRNYQSFVCQFCFTCFQNVQPTYGILNKKCE